MPNEKLNIGLIGLGRIADVHYPGYKLPAVKKKAQIYAVCDSNAETVAARQRDFKAVKKYTDYREMLADPELDAVEILTPQLLHEEMTLAALKARKGVALQKPMTTGLKSADRILQAAEETEVLFRVTDNYVFYPPVVLARKMIEAGEIGEVSSLRIKLTGGGSGGWNVPSTAWQWRLHEKSQGRGIQTFDHGHHLYATAWYLLGEVERVTAVIDSADGIIDCPAVIMFRHRERTAHSVITFTHSADMYVPSDYYANDEWMEITGSKGIIFIHRCTGKIHRGPGLSLFNGKSHKKFRRVKTDWQTGFSMATQNFIEALRGEADPLLTGRQARGILRLAIAAAHSSREERDVYPEELDAKLPALFRYRKKKAEHRGSRKTLLERLGFSADLSRYAPQAKELTEAMLERFRPEAVEGWSCRAGIELLADGTEKERLYSVEIKNGGVSLTEGSLPENADLVLTAKAGAWAAILLGKKGIEMAFLQGMLKITGKAEEGLRLKAAFGL